MGMAIVIKIKKGRKCIILITFKSFMWNMDTAHAIKVRTPVKRIECLWTPLGIMPNSLSRFYFSVFLWADNKTHLKPLTTWLVAGFCNSLESSWRKWRSRIRTKNRKLQLSIASSLSATTCCKSAETFPYSLSSHLDSFLSLLSACYMIYLWHSHFMPYQ